MATTSYSESAHKRIQTEVLLSKHQELREKLNFHSIYPYLNSHGLLDSDDLSLLAASSWDQVDRVIEYVPKCGKLNFLDEFIVCLEKSKDGTGSAHEELIDSLQSAYRSKMDSLKLVSLSPESGIIFYCIIVVGGAGS